MHAQVRTGAVATGALLSTVREESVEGVTPHVLRVRHFAAGGWAGGGGVFCCHDSRHPTPSPRSPPCPPVISPMQAYALAKLIFPYT